MDVFVIDIKGQKENTWQGSVKTQAGEKAGFRSSLEMLKAIDQALANSEDPAAER